MEMYISVFGVMLLRTLHLALKKFSILMITFTVVFVLLDF